MQLAQAICAVQSRMGAFRIGDDDARNPGVADQMIALAFAEKDGHGDDGFSGHARGEERHSPFNAVVAEDAHGFVRRAEILRGPRNPGREFGSRDRAAAVAHCDLRSGCRCVPGESLAKLSHGREPHRRERQPERARLASARKA